MALITTHAVASIRGWFNNVISSIPWPQKQKLLASDGTDSDLFGWSNDINDSGNIIIVGAPSDSPYGSSYVFTYDGNIWQQQNKLVPNNANVTAEFGTSVALNSVGNIAIIGAPGDDITGNINIGSTYIFTYDGSTWTQQQKLTASDGAAGDIFGTVVALNSIGNIAIIGAPDDDIIANANIGSAYIFTYNGSTWAEQQKLTASDGGAQDRFGSAVALNSIGNIAIIGSPLEEDSGPITQQEGAVYAYSFNGSTWLQQQKLKPSTQGLNFNFGSSVALNSVGNIAIIGAVGQGNATIAGGAAYIFTRTGNTWTEQSILYPNDVLIGDSFGKSVSINSTGNIVMIGASGDDINVNNEQGSAYIFTYNGSTWLQQQKLLASDGTASDWFGWSVALNENANTAIAGAWLANNNSNIATGATYVFTNN